MKKVGRNDPCPCGSGKKYKKCHMGKEDELLPSGLDDISVEDMGKKITSLSLVNHGKSREIADSLDLSELVNSNIGIKFVDFDEYAELNLFGTAFDKSSKKRSGGIFINLYKTADIDPDNVYLAISHDIDDSTLIHEIAHVLDYLGGSKLMPGTLEGLGFELGIPKEHLEHPYEYGHWLDYLGNRFSIQLDADDTIISYLYKNEMLIKAKEINARNNFLLKSKSDRILNFLSDNRDEVDELIRNLPGYIGTKKQKG